MRREARGDGIALIGLQVDEHLAVPAEYTRHAGQQLRWLSQCFLPQPPSSAMRGHACLGDILESSLDIYTCLRTQYFVL